jgi:hypothetical protein
MSLAVILKSFFRLNVEIGRVCFSPFRAFLSRVFRLKFNLNYCLCILDYGNGLPLYIADILRFQRPSDNQTLLHVCAFLFGFLT